MDEYVEKLNVGLYGPKWCEHCQKTQPVQTYKLAGSDWSKSEGMTYTAGFTGSHVCLVCMRPIKAQTEKEGSQK
jgi:hypothetical protein